MRVCLRVCARDTHLKEEGCKKQKESAEGRKQVSGAEGMRQQGGECVCGGANKEDEWRQETGDGRKGLKVERRSDGEELAAVWGRAAEEV